MKFQYTQTINDGQFTLFENDEIVGYIKYELAKNGNLIASRTFIDEKFRGQEIGKKLLNQLFEFAQKENVKIIPVCPYVVYQFYKHPEWNNLLDEEYLATQKKA